MPNPHDQGAYEDAARERRARRVIVFDIETIPLPDDKLAAMMPEFKAAANLKDPEKIAADIAAKRAAFVSNAALHWQTAEVALIGIGEAGSVTSHWNDDIGEKYILAMFLAALSESLAKGNIRIGGHNVKGFDLPMVINRARVHRIKIPSNVFTIYNGRPRWHENIFDTLDEFSFGKAFDGGNGVNAIASALGLPRKTGTGSDFPRLWREDRHAAISYNRQDVLIELGIAEACGI